MSQTTLTPVPAGAFVPQFLVMMPSEPDQAAELIEKLVTEPIR